MSFLQYFFFTFFLCCFLPCEPSYEKKDTRDAFVLLCTGITGFNEAECQSIFDSIDTFAGLFFEMHSDKKRKFFFASLAFFLFVRAIVYSNQSKHNADLFVKIENNSTVPIKIKQVSFSSFWRHDQNIYTIRPGEMKFFSRNVFLYMEEKGNAKYHTLYTPDNTHKDENLVITVSHHSLFGRLLMGSLKVEKRWMRVERPESFYQNKKEREPTYERQARSEFHAKPDEKVWPSMNDFAYADTYYEKYRIAYRLFGLSEGASKKEVTTKYRQLSRIYHPDKNKGNEEKAGEAMKALNFARELLMKK